MKKTFVKYYCDLCEGEFPKEDLHSARTFAVVEPEDEYDEEGELKKPHLKSKKMEICLECAKEISNLQYSEDEAGEGVFEKKTLY